MLFQNAQGDFARQQPRDLTDFSTWSEVQTPHMDWRKFKLQVCNTQHTDESNMHQRIHYSDSHFDKE